MKKSGFALAFVISLALHIALLEMLPTAKPKPAQRPISINATLKFLPFADGPAGSPSRAAEQVAGGYDANKAAQDEADEISDQAKAPEPPRDLIEQQPQAKPAPADNKKSNVALEALRKLQRSLLAEDAQTGRGKGGWYFGTEIQGEGISGTGGGYGGIGIYGTGGGEVGLYAGMIAAKIQQNVNRSLCKMAKPEIELAIRLKRDGHLLGPPRMVKSSGITSCDAAIERAVLLSLPLPVPADEASFESLRELNLLFRPNDENFGVMH